MSEEQPTAAAQSDEAVRRPKYGKAPEPGRSRQKRRKRQPAARRPGFGGPGIFRRFAERQGFCFESFCPQNAFFFSLLYN